MKKLLILLILAITVSVSGFLLYKNQQKPRYAGPPEKITFGISATAPELSSLILIAKHKDFFTANKIDAEIKTGETAVNVLQDLQNDLIDIGTSSDFVYVSNSFTAPKNFTILSSINKAGFLELVARKDSGIKSPQDLKGKKIGVTLKTAAEFYLGKFLALNNISLKDVTLVPIGPNEVADALSKNLIDATAMGEPQISQLKKQLDENAVAWPIQGDQGFYWLLVAKEEFINTHQQTMERVLRSLVEAEEFAKKSPEEAHKIVAQAGNRDLSYISSTWQKHDFTILLDQSLLLTLEDEARWRIENKLTDKTQIPNYLDFIHFDTVEKIKPDAVSIIH